MITLSFSSVSLRAFCFVYKHYFVSSCCFVNVDASLAVTIPPGSLPSPL